MNQIDPPAVIKEMRGLEEKAVTRWDEDATTMAVAAAKAGLEKAGISADDVGAMFFGSCTNPYVSKASILGVAEALTDSREIISADVQFATKSGTAALQVCTAMVDSGRVKYALALLMRSAATCRPMTPWKDPGGGGRRGSGDQSA